MAYGVTAEGFVIKPLEVIKAEIEASLRGEFGDGINLEPNEMFGQLVAIFSEREFLIWELMQAVYDSQYPDGAVGEGLDNVAGITGTQREAADYSTVDLLCAGDVGTVLLEGRVASGEETGFRFATTEEATLADVDAWGAGAVVAGDVVDNDGSVWLCSAGGTAAVAPTGEEDFTDGAVEWKWVGAGDASASVPAEAEETGPNVAYAYTVTEIETPVAGWGGVINPLDADLGADREVDAALRIRREEELQAQGTATTEAIRDRVSRVDDVTECIVFENETDVEVDGVPPHSFEVVVRGGDDREIIDAIGPCKGAGIQAYGSSFTGSYTDSNGDEHEISFTRPTEVEVWVIINATAEEENDLVEADVLAAMVAFADEEYEIGADVVTSKLDFPLWDNFTGLLDVTSILIGLSDPPVASTNLTIGAREVAVFDTSRIEFNLTV